MALSSFALSSCSLVVQKLGNDSRRLSLLLSRTRTIDSDPSFVALNMLESWSIYTSTKAAKPSEQ
jgi:hypothetical protein